MGNLKADSLSNKVFTLLLSMFLGVCAGFAYLANAPAAHAQSTGTSTDSFSFTTSTTAARIEPSSGNVRYSEVRCFNNSATVVYLGGGSSQVYPICTDTASCPEAALSVASSSVFAKAASGTPALTCLVIR